MFPLGALLAGRGVTSVYRAAQDTFCLAFPAAVFDAMIAASPVFQDFCTRRLAHLLDLSRSRLQAEYAATVTEQRGLATELRRLLRLPPITCAPDAALATVLRTMEQHRIGSIVVVDSDAMPLGIFTRQDVIGRIVLPQRSLDAPIRDVMSAPVVTLPAEAPAGDAALIMARRGIRRWPASFRSGTCSACSGSRCASSRPQYAARAMSRRSSTARATCGRCRTRSWRKGSRRRNSRG
jgi:CBS domain-containing protein